MKFSLQGKLYKFTCFDPRKFTKWLEHPLTELRLDYVKIAAYIDDLITLAYSFDVYFKNVWKCVKLLGNLGFVVHLEKSVFVPSQEIEYLITYN